MEDSYAAYCFDQAIAALGNGVTHRLNALAPSDRKAKALERKMQKELATILGLSEEETAKTYRTPTVTK